MALTPCIIEHELHVNNIQTLSFSSTAAQSSLAIDDKYKIVILTIQGGGWATTYTIPLIFNLSNSVVQLAINPYLTNVSSVLNVGVAFSTSTRKVTITPFTGASSELTSFTVRIDGVYYE